MLTKQIASKYIPAESFSSAPSTGKAIKLYITSEAAAALRANWGLANNTALKKNPQTLHFQTIRLNIQGSSAEMFCSPEGQQRVTFYSSSFKDRYDI